MGHGFKCAGACIVDGADIPEGTNPRTGLLLFEGMTLDTAGRSLYAG